MPNAMTMWYVGDQSGIPLTEADAVTTVEPIRDDPSTAEQDKAPDWNEIDFDESSQLKGLAPRLTGSDTIPTQKYAPWWVPFADANYCSPIDDQVSSSGTAAARELAGQQGHGTMQYAEGIEPVIRAGGAFGNDYFVSNPAAVQDGAGNFMTPIQDDDWGNAVAQRNANIASRAAYQDTQYAALFN